MGYRRIAHQSFSSAHRNASANIPEILNSLQTSINNSLASQILFNRHSRGESENYDTVAHAQRVDGVLADVGASVRGHPSVNLM